MTTEWNLKPGETIDRAKLHEQYGGRTQPAISPSKQTPNVFLFAGDPIEEEDRGIFSGWRQDGFFYFPGEGQTGDQVFMSGNQAVWDHKHEGRALRLFQGKRDEVEYLGEFTLPRDLLTFNCEYCDAPEEGGGPLRQIIMFRLEPIDTEPAGGRIGTMDDLLLRVTNDGVGDVPIESRFSEDGLFYPNREPNAIELRKRQLIQSYARYLEREGRIPTRKVIFPDDAGSPRFTDLYDDTNNTLIQVAGSVSQASLDRAVGSLLDLCRFRRQLRCEHAALLLPGGHYGHLALLACELGVEIIYPHNADRPSKAKEGEFVSVKPDPSVSKMAPSVPSLVGAES